MISFLMEALEDEDPRTQANAIESIGILKDKKTIPILLPFLNHPSHRIQANTAIALYPFRSSRKKAEKTIDKLYHSEILVKRLAALYAIGILKLKKYEKNLISLLDSPEKRLAAQAIVALARFKKLNFAEKLIEFILDEDEKFSLEIIFNLRKFPRESRFYLFEEISKLDQEKQKEIYSRLDHSSIDFSLEKSMIGTSVLPTSARF